MNRGTPQQPRGGAPDYLAVWEPLHDYWRLQVLGRAGQPVDSVWTHVPASRPRPDGRFLEDLGFVPLAEEDWEPDGDGWQRGVARGSTTETGRLVVPVSPEIAGKVDVADRLALPSYG